MTKIFERFLGFLKATQLPLAGCESKSHVFVAARSNKGLLPQVPSVITKTTPARSTQRRFPPKCIGYPEYRKIPKISPGAYIFQRPFLRGLSLEGLIFGRAYLWREMCVSKPIGLAS